MSANDILSALCTQNNTLLQAFDPEVMAFYRTLVRNQSGVFDILSEWYTTDCYEDERLDYVTHWMPLPEPPEGE